LPLILTNGVTKSKYYPAGKSYLFSIMYNLLKLNAMKKMKVQFASGLFIGLLLSLASSVAFSQDDPDQYLTNLQGKNMVLSLTGGNTSTYVKATPKEGLQTFYRNLCKSLYYPENLKKWGVEGTVDVEFVVEKDGQIHTIKVSEVSESIPKVYVEDLTAVAKEAILATSGNWDPAMVNGEPVASRAMVALDFMFEPQHEVKTPCSK
jgi:hypothetical protein